MTIGDRLRAADRQFRDTTTTPADVHLATARGHRPRRSPRRLTAVAIAAATVVAVTVAVSVWVASSRGTSPGPSADVAALAGRWTLVSATSDSSAQLRPDSTFTLDVAGGMFLFDDHCNDSGVAVTVDGDELQIGEGSSTAVGCGRDNEAVRTVRDHVFASGRARWAVSGTALTVSRDGRSMTFTRTATPAAQIATLTASSWTLTSAATNGTRATLPDEPVVLTFRPGAGSTSVAIDRYDGCNVLYLGVTIAAGRLDLGEGGSTTAACPSVGSVSNAVSDLFRSGPVAWSIADGLLFLERDAVSLQFERQLAATPSATAT